MTNRPLISIYQDRGHSNIRGSLNVVDKTVADVDGGSCLSPLDPSALQAGLVGLERDRAQTGSHCNRSLMRVARYAQ